MPRRAESVGLVKSTRGTMAPSGGGALGPHSTWSKIFDSVKAMTDPWQEASDLVKRVEDCYRANKETLREASGQEWTEFFMQTFAHPTVLGASAQDVTVVCKASRKPWAFSPPLPSTARCSNWHPGEFLWDLCWFPTWTFHPGCYAEAIAGPLPLVLECEWGNSNDPRASMNEVYFDFAKLLFARAQFKVMVFGFHRGVVEGEAGSEVDGFKDMTEKMKQDIRQTGDSGTTYVFLGIQWRWRSGQEDDSRLRSAVFSLAG